MSKKSLLIIFIFSFFLPKYDLLDLSLFTQLGVFIIVFYRFKIKIDKKLISLFAILFTFFLTISLISFFVSSSISTSQILKDVKLLLSLLLCIITIPTLRDDRTIFTNIDLTLKILFTINNIVMLLQISNESIRNLSLQIFNFGNLGYNNFSELATYSYGIRVNGIFQSFDLASIWMAFYLMLMHSKFIKFNFLLFFSTLIFIFFISRTGIVLFIIYVIIDIFIRPTRVKLLNLTSLVGISLITIYIYWDYFSESAFAWFLDDVKHEFNSIGTTINNSKLFGNYMPFYSNGAISDVGYLHILLTYGILFFIFIIYFYFKTIFFVVKENKLKLALLIIYIIGSFKTALIIGRGFWEFFILLTISTSGIIHQTHISKKNINKKS